MPAVETSGLGKRFGSTQALDGVDLWIPSGIIYGLLGPNGAGKTTLIRILATLLAPEAGSASVFGHEVTQEADAVRSEIALTGQFTSLDPDLTGRENLVLLALLLGFSHRAARQRAAEALSGFGLGDAAGRQVRTYSGGMQRRLDIAASLLVRPRLLFLDEPTTGLDPQSRNQVWLLVRDVVRSGTTVVLTTQYLDEADQLADRIGILDGGHLVAEGTPGELRAAGGRASLRVRLRDRAQRVEAARVLERVLAGPVREGRDPTVLSAPVGDPALATQALSQLTRRGIDLAGFGLDQPTLDEVFLTMTGLSGSEPPSQR